MDRMTSLPDEIIRVIACFLSATDATRVSILVKRLHNVFSIVSEVDVDANAIVSFTEYVDGVLGRVEPSTRIRKLSLKCRLGLDPPADVNPGDVNRLLSDVLKRGLMILELCVDSDIGYSLPSEFFTCKTIVNLKLGREFVISLVPKNALLPALETLILDSVRFDALGDCAFKALLLACPVLKELFIDGMYWETWKWSGIVCSQSLQRLNITREFSRGFHGDYQGISFYTPSLTHFDYTDFVPDAYPFVNFESLAKANLDIQVVVDHQWHDGFPEDGDLLSSNPTNLIQGIRNVKILELSSPLTFEAFYFFREAIPIFEKLHHLTMIHNEMGFCWRFLPFLLDKSPNLKTLLIQCGLHYVEEHVFMEEHDYVCECLCGYACLLTCPVEVLEITLWDNGTLGELEQVKHFLGKLSCLELLKIHSRESLSDREKLRITTHLLMLPRASAKCKIQISFT